MKRIIIILAIVFGLFFKLPVYADVIEVSRPPEVTDIKLSLERKVISTTDSWKVSVNVININPEDIDCIKIIWDNDIIVKLYYNSVSNYFEGEFINTNGIKEKTYSYIGVSVLSKKGNYVNCERSFNRNSLKIVVNNNCAKNLHTVYADLWEDYKYFSMDDNCPHKFTKVRKCNICKEITDVEYFESTISESKIEYSYLDPSCPHKITKVRKCNQCGKVIDTKYFEATFSNWIPNSKNEKGKICKQCNKWVKVPLPKKGTIFTWYNNKYRITTEGETAELISSIKNEESVIVPSSASYGGLSYYITSIAPNAFKNNTKMKNLEINSYVKNIGKQAFYGCKNLKNITIFTTNLTSKSIGSQAFTKAGSSNYKKLVVSVPKNKKASYIKLLRKSGLSSKAKIK